MRLATPVVLTVTLIALSTAVWAQAPEQQQQQVWVGRGEALRPAQTFFGPTGALQTPTAEVVGDDRWQVGYHFLQHERGDANLQIPKVSVGVGSHLEVNVAYAHVDGYDDLRYPYLDRLDEAHCYGPPGPLDVEDGGHVLVSAKLVLQEERGSLPGVAAGCMDIADEIDITPYVVVSKTLFRDSLLPVTLSGGVCANQRLMDDAFWSVGFHPLRRFDLIVENTGDYYNVGARWWPWGNLLVDAGWQDLMDSQFYVGASYLGEF